MVMVTSPFGLPNGVSPLRADEGGQLSTAHFDVDRIEQSGIARFCGDRIVAANRDFGM
jgi:hypothetical protein